MSFDQNGQSYSYIIILLGNIICVETYRKGPYVEKMFHRTFHRPFSYQSYMSSTIFGRFFANSIMQNMLYEKLN